MKGKKKLTIITALLCCFTLGTVACSEKQSTSSSLFEETQAVNLNLTYNEESGEIHWTGVDKAKKYVVLATNRFNDPQMAETGKCSYQLSLKAGINVISVTAKDGKGNEIGVGTLTVELSEDFGAPLGVENLAFDKATNTLSWTGVDDAVKYIVKGDELSSDENDFEREVSQTSFTSDFVFETGVYVYSVTPVSATGVKGGTAELDLRSYVDEKFNVEIEDGLYNLIDFSDSQAVEIMYNSDFREWDYGDPPVKTIPYEITSDGYLSITKPDDGKAYFGGVTISFPEAVEIGTLYVDLHRTGGDGCGVMVEDEYGHRAVAIGMEYGTEGYFETANQWSTFAFPLDRLRDSNYAFSKVKEITLYSRSAKRGTFSIDNIRYDKVNVGLMGDEIEYERDLNLLIWEKVPFAKEYSLKIDGETYTSKTNMLTIEKQLPVGEYVVEITAKNFESSRSGEYAFEVKPETPRGVVYSENTLTYDAVANVDYYYIRAVDVNGRLRFESETKKTSINFTLPDGLYEITVSSVKKGIYSERASIEYSSYHDPNFKKALGDGTYNLFDFENDEILLTAGASTYVEWGQSKPVNVPYSLSNKPNDIAHTSKALVLNNTSNNSTAVFGGATFTLPESVRIGTLYVDICRYSGDGCGVMLEDENGNQVPIFGLEYGSNGYAETASQFATLTISLSEIRKSAPAFSSVKKITFYARSAKGGVFCFDNVRYDEMNIGFVKDAYFDMDYDRLVWNEVENAKAYELTINGEKTTVYSAEYVSNGEISYGRHNITIKAINGRMMREKSFVIDVKTAAPDVSFDKNTKTATWDRLFGATSYEISLYNWNSGELIDFKQTSETSIVLSGISSGMYEIVVCGVTKDGLKGELGKVVCRTVTDSELGIGGVLGIGIYNLFDFSNANVLAISKYSDYIDWQWNGKPTLINIPYVVEDGVLKIKQETASTQHYGGAYFELENAISIYSFSFSHKRVSGDGAGVVLVDEKGNKAKLLGYEWSDNPNSDYVLTSGKWLEYTFTIEQIREINPEFGNLKGVHFYAHASKKGEYHFDNVYYS